MQLSKNILLIEDNSQARSEFINKLYELKYNIFPVASVNNALVEIHNQNINLIIMDILLQGGSNGFDFLEKIKKDERFKNIPVIVYTNLESEKEAALTMGVNEYLNKDKVSVDEVVKKIATYFSK